MTAKALVRERTTDEGIREITARNVDKVTRFRDDGFEELERQVKKMEARAGDVGTRKRAMWKVDERPREGQRERQPWFGGGKRNENKS